MTKISIFLLGSPRIERAGEDVVMDTRKALALIAYLAIQGQAIPRDTLATIFWPDSDQPRARGALRRTLSALRKGIGSDVVISEGQCLASEKSTNLWLDVQQFEMLIAQSTIHEHATDQLCQVCLQQLSDAANLYRGDFLSGFTIRGSHTFDEWQVYQTESLRRSFSHVLERLVSHHGQEREFENAIGYAQRWLSLDPLHEPAYFQIMQLYTLSGQRSLALRQFKQCEEILSKELGTTPQDEITQLYKDIQNNRLDSLPSKQIHAPIAQLPFQPTNFIGREVELEDISSALRDGSTRMLTLVGPGGIGKTRLALQAAVELTTKFSNGINFIPLASINSPGRLVTTIADALKLAFFGKKEPKEQLFNFLQGKDKLLILDNYEHLLAIDGTDFLVEILSTVSGVKLLVTSRERLNIQWELPYEVKGLRVPHKNQNGHAETYSSVQLFMQSANRIKPNISYLEDDKQYIVQICKDLQGLPLGIELAASWVSVASCKDIAQQISQDLKFLTTSRRDIPERHKSLQAVFNHSWDLLTEKERAILPNLAVFRSGFTIEAFQQIIGASLHDLSSFINKSFLMQGASARLEMLEVIRQYAEEKNLHNPGRKHTIRDKHCEYYAAFLKERELHFKTSQQRQVVDEISEEIDNIRAAWQWAINQEKRNQIDDCMESLSRYFDMRSWHQEGKQTFEMAVSMMTKGQELKDVSENNDLVFAKVLTRYGWMCAKLYDFESGTEAYAVSLSIAKYHNALDEVGLLLNLIGIATASQGELDKAKDLFAESLSIYKSIEMPWGIANSLNNLGLIATIKNAKIEAKDLISQSLDIRRELGNQSSIIDSLTNLGVIADELGEYEDSKEFHVECIKIADEINDTWAWTNGHCNLGFALIGLGEFKEAKESFQKCLKKAIDVSENLLILETSIGIATIDAREGNYEVTAEILSCIINDPALFGKPLERAKNFHLELENLLGPEEVALAQKRAKSNNLEHYFPYLLEKK